MLSKLLKYEFKSTARLMLPIYLLVIAYALICRLFIEIAKAIEIFNILSVLMVSVYILILLGAFIVTYVLMIQRFYKNLTGDEGYLMFTLPVTPEKHIITKLITSCVWLISSVIVSIISIFILIYSKGMIKNSLSIFSELMNSFSTEMSFPAVSVIIGWIISMIVSLAASIMMIYVSIALGQLFTGHKLIGSIISYVGIHTFLQILSTFMFIFISISFPDLWNNMLNNTGNYVNLVRPNITYNTEAIVINTLFTIATAGNLLTGGSAFFVTNFIFKNKLNLD